MASELRLRFHAENPDYKYSNKARKRAAEADAPRMIVPKLLADDSFVLQNVHRGPAELSAVAAPAALDPRSTQNSMPPSPVALASSADIFSQDDDSFSSFSDAQTVRRCWG